MNAINIKLCMSSSQLKTLGTLCMHVQYSRRPLRLRNTIDNPHHELVGLVSSYRGTWLNGQKDGINQEMKCTMIVTIDIHCENVIFTNI